MASLLAAATQGARRETLHEYDIKAPLASHIDVPYRQAIDWICEGMAPLGEGYVTFCVRGALDERWVDIYPNKGANGWAPSPTAGRARIPSS